MQGVVSLLLFFLTSILKIISTPIRFNREKLVKIRHGQFGNLVTQLYDKKICYRLQNGEWPNEISLTPKKFRQPRQISDRTRYDNHFSETC